MAFRQKHLVLVLISVLLLGGCFGKGRKRSPSEAPDKLYTKALVQFNSGKFETAMEKFKDVKNYYPESPEALRAEIRIADSHFFLEEYEEAIALYEEFRKLHPYHEDIPYVLFQIGQAYYKQMKSSDRDPTPARKALLNFEYLIKNYPPSVFTEAAKRKIAVCQERLAEHEFLVGRFYYKKASYQGAVRRFEGVLRTYPDTDVAPKALFYMGKAYMHLSQGGKAREAFLEITRRYPKSEYAAKAQAFLQTETKEGATSTDAEEPGGSTVPPM